MEASYPAPESLFKVRMACRTELSPPTPPASSRSTTCLPAGTFKIKVTATDLQPYESFEIPLRAGENRQLPIIALPIATSNVTVQVVVTQEQVANEQVTAQIHQRVFGVLPNFYTSFVWDAAPLNPQQKFRLAFRSATDPVTFLTTGFLAGIQQARDTYPDYGQGAEGYGKLPLRRRLRRHLL